MLERIVTNLEDQILNKENLEVYIEGPLSKEFSRKVTPHTWNKKHIQDVLYRGSAYRPRTQKDYS